MHHYALTQRVGLHDERKKRLCTPVVSHRVSRLTGELHGLEDSVGFREFARAFICLTARARVPCECAAKFMWCRLLCSGENRVCLFLSMSNRENR